MKYNPHDYQIYAINFIKEHPIAAILLDMGMGNLINDGEVEPGEGILHHEEVEDREAQIANITEDIRNGNTGYLNDFLNALISDSIREGMTDIFGKGTELDDSEGVQTARKAKELLDKLAEYKPLAKIEELEECNYNMIDNVLNNEKPKEEKQAGRISIKEKLAEKKAVIEQRDKSDKEVPEKGTEKKSEREI